MARAAPLTVPVSAPEVVLNAAGSPLGRLGQRVLDVLVYLGGLGILAASVVRAIIRPRPEAPPLLRSVLRQSDWMLCWGLVLVALAHVGIGSFLAMQAFYGATFVEAVGPVVGVGLCRNVAPLISGLIFAGLLAGRLTPVLSKRPLRELDDPLAMLPDRDVASGRQADTTAPPDPARLAAVRILAAMVVGPVLGLCGAGVGTLVGWSVAHHLLGIPTHTFTSKLLEMLWGRDVVGLFAKGLTYSAASALVACHEGLRLPYYDASLVPAAATRAVCVSFLAILMLNSGFFVLMYMAGPAFGPTVVAPPVH